MAPEVKSYKFQSWFPAPLKHFFFKRLEIAESIRLVNYYLYISNFISGAI